jgi:hypothetical protein
MQQSNEIVTFPPSASSLGQSSHSQSASEVELWDPIDGNKPMG